jgi:hypothetical protein
VKRELEEVRIPRETEARERARAVVLSAFAERVAVPRPSHWPRIAAVAVALAGLGAATLSSPGRAVLHELREVVGVKRAQPALFSLPAPGRLLVSSNAGVWIVEQDGSKRLLGDYREASWSPFGRFVVAARENELAALERDGDVRWTLARPGVRSPRWTGTDVDTRIAYVDRTGLRVVAGDGTGDRLLVPGFRGAFAWKPGRPFTLAYASSSRVTVRDVEAGQVLWRSRVRPAAVPIRLEWSRGGARVLAATPRSLRVYDSDGSTPLDAGPGMDRIESAALAATGQAVAFVQVGDRLSSLWTIPRIRHDANAARRLFSGPGGFGQVSWAPSGEWLVLSWPDADQWVFVRADGRGVRAAGNLSEQFRSRTFPRIEGWCCAR